MEKKVHDRTADLARAVRELRGEVAERKLTEQSLRRTTRILDARFTSGVSPFVILDRDFNFVRVNEAYAKDCGRKVDDFPGHNHFEFFPNRENEAIFRKVVRLRKPFQVKAKPFSFADHPEWGVTYWDWTLDPVLDDRGRVEYLVFALNDVTEETRAHEELRRNEALLREQAALLEMASDAIIVRDSADRITYWNHGAEVIYGWPREEALGKVIHDLLGTRFPEPLAAIADRVMREDHWDGELSPYSKRRADDHRRKLLGSAQGPGRKADDHPRDQPGHHLAQERRRTPCGVRPSTPGGSSRPASIPSWPSARPGRSRT